MSILTLVGLLALAIGLVVAGLLVVGYVLERRQLRVVQARLETEARIRAATRATLSAMREAVRQAGRDGTRP